MQPFRKVHFSKHQGSLGHESKFKVARDLNTGLDLYE